MAHAAPHVTGPLTEHFGDDAFASLHGYRAHGGYEVARRVLHEMTPEEVIDCVKASGLQGRGGAGFPTGLKWSFMPREVEGARYLVCNADESEPGSFKDRMLIERGPHQLLEGILIAGFAIGAEKSFVYVRGEYALPARILQRAIDEAQEAGVLGTRCLGSGFGHEVVLVRGAGAYICGEETGLLESLEGKKGQPRRKPPFPAERGAFGRPTTVNNVETLCHIPQILRHGAQWFRSRGTDQSPGTLLFGVSGHVVRPGLYELPLGTPLDEIVFQHAGGVPEGGRVKGVIPGGLSTPVLPADRLDVPMAHEPLRERGSLLGTGGVIVMDQSTCMVRVGCVIAWFFRDESCGQCTTCREGTAWTEKLMRRIERGDASVREIALLEELAVGMEASAICGLADAAAWPVQGLLRHFRGEFQRHVETGGCPLPGSFTL